jgi:hypothetical protein
MKTWQLKHLIKTIDETLEKREEDLKKFYLNELCWKDLSVSQEMMLKAEIGKLVGGPGGELLFIKTILVRELQMREAKKFWQFWK